MTTVYATRCPSGDAATPPTDLNRDRSLLTSPCGFAAPEKPSEPIATMAVAVLTLQLKHLDARIRHRLLRHLNSFRPVILGTCRYFVNEAELLREDEFEGGDRADIAVDDLAALADDEERANLVFDWSDSETCRASAYASASTLVVFPAGLG